MTDSRPKLGILLVVLVLAGGCAANVGSAVHQGRVRLHTLIYSAAGSGTAVASNIYFGGYVGGDAASNVPLPWTKTIRTSTLPTAGGPISLNVQNGPVVQSYVVCTISEDGKVLSTEKAVGPHAIAECQT